MGLFLSRDERFLRLAMQLGLLNTEQVRVLFEERRQRPQGTIEQYLITRGALLPNQVQQITQHARSQSGEFSASAINAPSELASVAAHFPPATPHPSSAHAPQPGDPSRLSPMPSGVSHGSGLPPQSGSGLAGPRSSSAGSSLKHSQHSRAGGRPRTRNPANLQPGERLDRYAIISEIARGGMGAVFRAQADGSTETVALKIMLVGDEANERQTQRFHREIETNSSLQHPNIIRLIDAGDASGCLYYTMELVDGADLEHLIKDDKLSLFERIEIMVKVAEGVGFAHEAGIFHRDLKPANILVAKDGTPKVTDFGLAKSLFAESDLTKSGATVGTTYYMSPEQVRGETRTTDQRCDVWALGVMLYELSTGRIPFKADRLPQLYELILESEPAPPESLNPEVKGGLGAIIDHCLEKSAEDRYFNGSELAEDLRSWLDDGAVSVAGQSAASRLAKGIRKRKRSLTGVFLILGLATLVVVGSLLLIRYQDDQRSATQLAHQIDGASRGIGKALTLSEKRMKAGHQALEEQLPAEASLAFREAAAAIDRALTAIARLPLEPRQKLEAEARHGQLLARRQAAIGGDGRARLANARTDSERLLALGRLKEALDEGAEDELWLSFGVDLGLTQQSLGRRNAAQETLRRLRRLPKTAERLPLLVANLALERAPKDALAAAEQALKIRPKHRATLFIRARALARMGRISEAESTLKPLAAKDIGAAMLLAELLVNTPGRFVDGTSILDALWQRHRDRSDIALRLAEAALLDNRPEDAEPLLKELIAKDQRDRNSMRSVECALLLDQPKRAARLSSACLSQSLDSVLPRIELLSWQLLRAPDIPGQEELLGPFLAQLKPLISSDAVRRRRASVIISLWLRSKARDPDSSLAAALAPAIKVLRQSQDPAEQSSRAYLLAFEGQERAEAEARIAIGADPNDPLARAALARATGKIEHRRAATNTLLAHHSLAGRALRRAQLLRRRRQTLGLELDPAPPLRVRKDTSSAIKLSELARRLAPWSTAAWTNELARRLGAEDDEVLQLSASAIKVHPAIPELLVLRARALLADKPKAALKAAAAAIKASGGDDAKLALAEAQLACGQMRPAAAKLKELSKASPRNVRCLRALLRAQRKLKQLKAAKRSKQTLDRLTIKRSAIAEQLRLKARKLRKHTPEKCIPILAEALAIDPYQSSLYADRAQVWARLNLEPKRALYCFRDLGMAFYYDANFIEDQDTHPNMLRRLIPFDDIKDDCIARANKGQKVLPEDEFATALLHYLDLDRGSHSAKAIATASYWCERAIHAYPNSISMRVVRGFYRTLRSDPRASADLLFALDYLPGAPSVIFSLALIEAKGRRYSEAFDWLEQSSQKLRAALIQRCSEFTEFKPMLGDPRWKALRKK